MAQSLSQFAERMKREVEAKIRTLKAMDGIRLAVGIDPSAKYPNGKSVAEVANFVEFGTRYMPPRPFMRVARAEHEDEWRGELRRAVARSIQTGAGIDLSPLADQMKADVQESIESFGISDTGRLHDSVVATVEKGVG